MQMLQHALHGYCAQCSSAAGLRLREPWRQVAGEGCLQCMEDTDIAHCDLFMQCSSAKLEPKLGLSCAATARQRVQKGAYLHIQRQSICAAASPATSRQCVNASGDVDSSSRSAAGQGNSVAGAEGLEQRLISGADSSEAEPASSEPHSSGTVHSIELPNGRHSLSGMPKQPKKVIPWPTAIRACEPLPADPMTWQNAAVLIDKPLGWTSFDVCAKLRAALRIKKVCAGLECRRSQTLPPPLSTARFRCQVPADAPPICWVMLMTMVMAEMTEHNFVWVVHQQVGHAGTLDPEATGLLIICVGKGCKKVVTAQLLVAACCFVNPMPDGTMSPSVLPTGQM